MPTGNKLEQIALTKRVELEVINTYKGDDPGNGYSVSHTNAIGDSTTPEHGRGNGTGDSLDTPNYNIGTKTDIEGNPEVPGSGRIAAIANNGSTWGYTPDEGYEAPDTSGNLGQFHMP
jgi:hypothetical protein